MSCSAQLLDIRCTPTTTSALCQKQLLEKHLQSSNCFSKQRLKQIFNTSKQSFHIHQRNGQFSSLKTVYRDTTHQRTQDLTFTPRLLGLACQEPESVLLFKIAFHCTHKASLCLKTLSGEQSESVAQTNSFSRCTSGSEPQHPSKLSLTAYSSQSLKLELLIHF